MATAAQVSANRQNAQKSTGPRTAEGLGASSQNNFRHGLRGKFQLFASEDRAEYDALLESLREDHQPAGITEDLIVQRMSEHFWLARRAERFQFESSELLSEGLSGMDDFNEAMALWMRYETTHERAFFKCLNELNKVKAERRKQQRQNEIGFERQKQAEANEARKQAAEIRKQADESRKAAAETRKQELHEHRLRMANAKIAALLTKNTAPVHSNGAASVSEHNITESATAKS